jgi:hypothetical protein
MPMVQASTLIGREDTSLTIIGELTHELLATSPGDPEVYQDRVGVKAADSELSKEEQEVHIVEEVDTLPEEEVEKAVTVFHRDEHGIFLWPYQIQGFLKAAGEAMRQTHGDEKLTGAKGTKWGAIKGKIDRFVTVHPERIYLFRGGIDGQEKAPIMEPDGLCTRPLRAMTAKGERVSISKSESISPGARFKMQIDVLEGAPITEEMLVQMLAYGERVGLLQWRNSGKGRFIAFIDAEPNWVPSDKIKGTAKA